MRRLAAYACLLLFISTVLATSALGQVSVLTAQNDNARTSANLNETVLNTSNVNANQFGRLFSRSVDGSLYAQPLYVPNVAIPGKGTHNVIYVATMHNTVAAFDADDPSQASPFWQVNLGPSVPCCPTGFLSPEYGILSTPVIDPATSTLYAVAANLINGSYSFRLHAFDITTGQEKFGAPVTVQASVPGTGAPNQGGNVIFDPGQHLQRPGLLLANGVVYMSFASIDDGSPWHGWVLGYNASDVQQQVFVFNPTPNGDAGGVWQSGRGLASDANGYIYLITGNGDYDGTTNFGDSIIKLNPTAGVADWFTPDNQASLNVTDSDLGASGPLLIPGTSLLIGGGKEGILYVMDSNNMGHLVSGNMQIVQHFQATPGEIHHVAYWNRSGAPLLYLWGSGDVLKAFQFSNGVFNTTPVAQSPTSATFPGGVLSLSANGSTPGTGILWATTAGGDASESVVQGTLRAIDAADVSRELWNSDDVPSRDSLGSFAKFSSPTIANGKVYVSTFSNQLDVYGLLSSPTPGVSIWVGPASVTLATNGQQQQFTATVAGTSNTAVTWSMSPAIGTLSANGLYTAPYPGTISSSRVITITATSVADPTKSATTSVTLNPVSGTTGTAAFVTLDTTTQGNWKGVYGADGYNVINNATSYPSYVTVTPSGNSSTTWASSTTDTRALLKAGSTSDRIAATWYNSSSFSIDVAFNDGRQHQVAIYCLDWDSTSRAERIDILDANGVLLDSRDVTGFHSGQYLVWQLSGHLKIRVSEVAADLNAVISGLFFQTGPAPVSISVTPPSAALNANGLQFFQAQVWGTNNTAVTWSMNPSVGTLSASGLYTAPASTPSYQTIDVAATSVADPSKSGHATVTLGTVTTSATFVNVDTTTQGNWKGVYGGDGYNVINDTVAYPSYVTVTPSGPNAHTWADPTTDVRALLKAASATDRIAAAWYSSSSFSIDLVFNDGAQHQVAVYCLDWDSTTRAETIDILDANGNVLSSQNVSNFHNGAYVIWQLSGHVQIRVTNAAGSANGVISGLFFDPVSNAAATTYSFTGPSGGPLNTASGNFTVQPNGLYTGTITITPSGGGLSTATVLTFNNSSAAQTFTITPTAVGPVTLTPSDSGSLSDPPALTYATPPAAPTIGTATAGNAQITVAFTPPAATGGSAITSYTAKCGTQTASGAASPITVTGLTNGTAYTCTVTATNAAGVSAPSAASNSVTPNATATSYTFTGPSGGPLNTASSNFTVQPNGVFTGTITITPSGGGLSTPIPLTFNNSSAARTFAITPTAVGPVTLTPSNNGSLTNPPALSYATPPAAPTIGTATAGNAQATVSFTPPAATGGSPITSYTATCGTQSASGTASPITVTGLTNGTAYTCTVTATNAAGVSAPSAASNSVIPGAGGNTGTATFVTLDTTTQGNWKGVYGADGYNVINNAVVYPNYVAVTPSGANSTIWASSTTDVRALLKAASSTDRIAATWYTTGYNNTSSFLIDLAFSDGAQHQFALYCLDWDSTQRAETIDVLDANGVLLNSQNVSKFHNGQYLVWQLGGHVQVRVRNIPSSSNAVISGLFFDPVPVPATSYTFTGPSGGPLNTASGNFTVTPNGVYAGTITITPSGGGLSTATVLTFNNSSAAQTFTITPTAVGPVTLTPSDNGSLTDPPALTYATPPAAPTIGTATAGNAQITVAFTPPAATGGSPITGYTAKCGAQTANGAASPITVTGLTNGTAYTCTVTATNAAGVSAPSAASNSVTPNATATSYTFTGPSGGPLNTASSNFTVQPNGLYTGNITITPSGGGLTTPTVLTFNNSSAARTFTITPATVGPVTLTPTNNGSLTNPPALSYATPPAAPTIGTATAGNAQATVSFTPPAATGGSPITSYTATCGTQSASGAASPITVAGLTNGTAYTCTVTATNAAGVSAPSAASNSVTPGAGGNTGTATFVTLDTTTQGNWKGVYGADGYNVINNAVAYPSYVTITPAGANSYTWAGSTTDVRALLKAASSTDRIAATWYTSGYNGTSFSIDTVFNDGLQHKVAVYCLDWDSTQRAERIDILDANGVVLDSRNVSGFHNGQYVVWQLSGHVQIRVTSTTANGNGVISGLFFR